MQSFKKLFPMLDMPQVPQQQEQAGSSSGGSRHDDPNMSRPYSSQMEELIPAINKLQEIFQMGVDEINLPQIVVVGSQSSGKSSVLESLVGKSFLPRGTGIVTRCPIVIQMVLENTDDNVEGYWTFQFDHDKENQYTDLDEVCEQIENKTAELAGDKDDICMEPIIIKVFSNRVIPLTVVDLPGMVKYAIGDQPDDIEFIVDKLIRKYIENENVIILAVSPATQDIATSDSVKLSREVDPDGERTLHVITKLDLMDLGTDARKLLSGGIIPSKHGIIGVKNRSQQEIDKRQTLEGSRADEEKFFRKHYPFLKGNCGSTYLGNSLNKLLSNHIQTCLPDLKIMSKIDACEKIRRELGPVLVNNTARKWEMDDGIKGFVDAFGNSLHEKLSLQRNGESNFAAEIAHINLTYSDKIRDFNFDGDDLPREIECALANSVSIELLTSIPNTFKALAEKKILELKPIWEEAALKYLKVLKDVIHGILLELRWKKLANRILTISKGVLDNQFAVAKESIKVDMEIRTAMFFSKEESYLQLLKIFDTNGEDDEGEAMEAQDALEALLDVPRRIPGQHVKYLKEAVANMVGKHAINKVRELNRKKFSNCAIPISTFEDKRLSVDYTRCLILEYCGIKKRQIADYMPNHLLYHLFKMTVKRLKDEIRRETDGMEDALIAETEDVAQKRQENDERLKNLYKAKEVIDGLQIPEEFYHD